MFISRCRAAHAVLALVVTTILLLPATAGAQSWPAVFDPFALRTFNLMLDRSDWDTIRHDTTNEIEVPARFWADEEAPIVVTVRRKSSRALPSEADPVKVGLKIDINELVAGQQWHGLVKLSLENAGDIPALYEGMAWQLHQLAANAHFYGHEAYPALANWVKVTVNGESLGVYTNVEQRDTQFLRNRGIRVSGQTWLYEVDDIDSWVLESGDPHSPAFTALCYAPFAPTSKGQKTSGCATPEDDVLEATLDALIEMDAMLAQAAVDAFTDNPDALVSHGKNFFFADFNHSGLKRRYYPWDLDAVFRNSAGGIYGKTARRGVSQSPYQRILLNHPGFRVRYNAILSALVAPAGPLSQASLHGFLDALEPVLLPALLEDPFVVEDPAPTFQALKTWISERIANVQSQVATNGPPPPR